MKKAVRVSETVKDLRKQLREFSEIGEEYPEGSLNRETILIGGESTEDVAAQDISIEPERVKIDSRRIEKAMDEEGIEAVAWYAPFHKHEPTCWGIYYDAEGIAYFAKEVFDEPLSSEKFKKTLKAVRQHEIFHFKAEILCTLIEMTQGCACYHEHSVNNRHLEEALATAAQYRGFREPRKKELNRLLRALPGGYSDYGQYSNESDFRRGVSELISSIADILAPKMFVSFRSPFMGFYGSASNILLFADAPYIISAKDVPERLIVDPGATWIQKGRPFPAYAGCKVNVYLGDHIPPHVHIFIPPDKERGRYLYPIIKPYGKDVLELSNKDMRKLANYFSKYGDEIVNRIREVYPDCREAHSLPKGIAL